MTQKRKLPIIVGPTAGGKSSLALRLASEFGCEILSCDSMQVYRGMDIGTAKPTPDEQALVPHHMIDIVSPFEAFSCAEFALRAQKEIEDIFARGKTPLVCGGTGLYLDALLRGGLSEAADEDPAYRQELATLASEKGNEAVHALLRTVDPESADAIHMNNLKRVIRALEIYRVTGVPKSRLDKEKEALNGVYEPAALGLFYEDRDALYRRIEERVDEMMHRGLEDEVRGLAREGVFEVNSTAAGAIGYKEFLQYFAGTATLAETVEDIKKATRHYAKRQMTWFRAKAYVTPLVVESGDPEKIYKNAKKFFQFA